MKNLFAYDSSGTVIVLTDGTWLLTHGGMDETPQWKTELASEPVGVGAAAGVVAALEAGGRLTFWDAKTGESRGAQSLAGNFIGLASARTQARFLAATSEVVVVAEPSADPRPIPAADTTAAALSADGTRMALGSASGKVRILTAAAEPVGESQVPGAVSSLCWGGLGQWLLTSGDRILQVPADGGPMRPVTRAEGMVPTCIAASDEGRMFAARLKPQVMMALAYPSLDTVVQLRYPEREVVGVGFGPGMRPGLALRGGDGNIVDIPGEQLLRTDTFPGRQHNRWLVNVLIKPEHLPPVSKPKAPAPPSTGTPPHSAPEPAAAATPVQARRPNWALRIAVLVLVLNFIRWMLH